MPGQRFTFGPFQLDADRGALLRDGAPLAAGHRGILLLQALVRRPGEVVSKAELMAAGWSDSAVEESNLTVQIASLRKLLGRTAEGLDWIVTVPRIGYRFVAAQQPPPPTVEPGPAAIQAAAPGPEPSIAVLPFANLSADPEQEYFADGLSEDIITGLSRIRWLFVSARNSSFRYKGRSVDVTEVGRELGVRYVLEGSVRRSGQRVRISAQLIDASTGLQVWAERYDAELVDFFALQDQITANVIASIEPRLYAAENLRFQNRPTESLDAWGFVMRAMPHVWTWGSLNDIETAEALLKRATDIDPDYARANSLLAWTQGARAHLGWGDPAEMLAAAMALAQRAIAKDWEDPWGHLSAGYVHMVSRRFTPAVEELSEAINRNPSFAQAHMILGSTYAYGGKVEDGLRQTSLAMRLSPRDHAHAANLSVTGLCHLLAGRFAEAIEFERRAVQMRPHFGTAWRTLAAAAGLAGDRDTAAQALAEAKRQQPNLTLDWVERYHPIVHEKDRTLYVDGLRAAGLD